MWAAEDEVPGLRVAVKAISSSRAGEGEARTRLLRGARTMATVEPPHVVRVYACGEAGGQAYFAMERGAVRTSSDRGCRLTMLWAGAAGAACG